MKCIEYNSGYKYQLKQSYTIRIDIKPLRHINQGFLEIDTDGYLTIHKGYAWDGPSGPAFDTKNFMRGSLIHDALYQLMRVEQLDENIYREKADRLLQKICKEDGMSSLRAWGVYQAVRNFGGPSADPAAKRPTKKAPSGCGF